MEVLEDDCYYTALRFSKALKTPKKDWERLVCGPDGFRMYRSVGAGKRTYRFTKCRHYLASRNWIPMAVLEVFDNTVTLVYTQQKFRRQGYATLLYREAQHEFPYLQIGTNLTKLGHLWSQSLDSNAA